MAKAIVNVSDIFFNIKDANTKYLFFRVIDKSKNNFSADSINYKIKVSSNSSVNEYLTNSENNLFGR